ncbi:ester cyclase [Exiguobacterium sp. B2(2022)]|uniref:ester cyclase n=1 Tax=Exiguobacterium sp. B2(2022) TaxID=2992755 RepID=UPI00237A9D02|nr:ester cyclase [Exiguobacterium sp. B2(2022)]MDE0563194.1 ester cyclase [Exiguobacterium sp. B2(2022)]
MNREEQIRFAAYQVIELGKMQVVPEVFATEYVAHAGERTYQGHAFIRRFSKQMKTAIPDVKVKKIEVLVQTENTVSWQRTLIGTHRENMLGIPASGKQVEWVDMVVSRFQEGLIVEEWVVSELMGELLVKQPEQ